MEVPCSVSTDNVLDDIEEREKNHDNPTTDPTMNPTLNPSASPTTPAPTHPGELICGSHKTGDYNGEPITVEVRMPYDGDMTLDASASDFDISRIMAHDARGKVLADSDSSASVLAVYNLTHFGDYNFTITGVDGQSSGTFDILIECTSAAPTRSPTSDPTSSPSIFVTEDEEEFEDYEYEWRMVVIIFSGVFSVPLLAVAAMYTHQFCCKKPQVVQSIPLL